MKVRLNLTIDDTILNRMKRYAEIKQTSISELVEEYFKTITRPARRKNIIQFIDKMEKPSIGVNDDLKEAYYQGQAKKYGF